MVTVNNLSKSFGEKKVLEGLSVTLEQNRVTALMGTSGCGKTTFANLLLGLLQPDSGTIEGLSGKLLSSVFQEDRLCQQLSAIGNVRLVLNNKVTTTFVMQQLAAVGLDEDSATKPVRQLSGGQRRRVAIVRAMMADSDFICLDEPFKGLDKATKENTMAYVKKSVEGKTVLLITHDNHEAKFFSSQQIELSIVANEDI